ARPGGVREPGGIEPAKPDARRSPVSPRTWPAAVRAAGASGRGGLEPSLGGLGRHEPLRRSAEGQDVEWDGNIHSGSDGATVPRSREANGQVAVDIGRTGPEAQRLQLAVLAQGIAHRPTAVDVRVDEKRNHGAVEAEDVLRELDNEC